MRNKHAFSGSRIKEQTSQGSNHDALYGVISSSTQSRLLERFSSKIAWKTLKICLILGTLNFICSVATVGISGDSIHATMPFPAAKKPQLF